MKTEKKTIRIGGYGVIIKDESGFPEGTVVKIKSKSKHDYTVAVNNGKWYWASFHCVKPATKAQSKKYKTQLIKN